MSREATAYDVAIGERAAHIRKVLAMTMSEVASRLNVTRQTLANYESGRTPMRASVIRQLCEVYGCQPTWLLGMDDRLHVKRKVGERFVELTETSPAIRTGVPS